FCYDPETQELEGWRIGTRGRYRAIKANDKGWLWVEELGLWLGIWRGKYQEYDQVWLRFYDKQGRLVATGHEAEARPGKGQARRRQGTAPPGRGRGSGGGAAEGTAGGPGRAEAGERQPRRLRRRGFSCR